MSVVYVDVPPPGWWILDVMRKDSRRIDEGWVALLIDTDPDIFCAGLDRHKRTQSCWLDLGKCRSRDAAWERAEQLMATKH